MFSAGPGLFFGGKTTNFVGCIIWAPSLFGRPKKVNWSSCCSVQGYKEVANSTSTTPIADREYSVLTNYKPYYVHYVFLRPYMSDERKASNISIWFGRDEYTTSLEESCWLLNHYITQESSRYYVLWSTHFIGRVQYPPPPLSLSPSEGPRIPCVEKRLQ